MPSSLLLPHRRGASWTPAWWLGLSAAVVVPLDAAYVQIASWLMADAVYLFPRPKYLRLFYGLEGWRALPPLAVVGLLVIRRHLPRHAFGLGLGEPRRTVEWIVRCSLVAAAGGSVMLIVAIAGVRIGCLHLTIEPTDLHSTERALEVLLHMCVLAPLVEELIYRGILVAALAQLAGPARAIVASGMAFVLLHLLYERPAWWAPFYFATGMLFAWAFVRSQSLVAPLVLHSLGNLVAWSKDWLILERRPWIEWFLN
jgi:membrane protease YdiL (CAAX protease family)